MRRVFKQGGAIFALLAILITPVVYADDLPPGMESPQARIGPPTGAAAESPTLLELFWTWVELQVRIGPPTG